MTVHAHTIYEQDELAAAHLAPAVCIVDADSLIRERLAATIRSEGWQVRTFASAEELLAEPLLPVPGCILVDVELPGLSGLELQSMLAARAEIPVIFASAHLDVQMTVRAMKAGAVDFLTKPVTRETLLSAVGEALERNRLTASREAELHVTRARFASLTPRERQVMQLVICGLLNKQVACELGISQITVKVHRGRVMRKMRVSSLAGLVTLGAKLGLGGADLRRGAHTSTSAVAA